jgi:peptidoglycan/xylan/chitin deacetylase (PgdA/CDA1 family)
VSDNYTPAWPAIKKKQFNKIIKYISKYYSIIDFSDIPKQIKSKKPQVIITFDDGYKEFSSEICNYFFEKKIPVTLNIIINSTNQEKPILTQRINDVLKAYLLANITSFNVWLPDDKIINICLTSTNVIHVNHILQNLLISQKNEDNIRIIETLEQNFPIDMERTLMMNWDEVLDCVKKEVSIGSHTMTHTNLNLLKDNDSLYFELSDSKKIIEHRTGKPVEVLAFPVGNYNEQVVDVAKNIGYKFLLTTEESQYKSVGKQDLYLLPRITVYGSYIENIFRIQNFHSFVKKLFNAK